MDELRLVFRQDNYSVSIKRGFGLEKSRIFHDIRVFHRGLSSYIITGGINEFRYAQKEYRFQARCVISPDAVAS